MKLSAWSILVIVVLSPSAATAGETGYYTQPALHGNTLVFQSEGDLFVADISTTDGEPNIAHRLTSGVGREGRPVISPDGSTVAFTAQYDGNTDVYIMPIDGGAPTRLTFHPDTDITVGWSHDGRSVLFHSGREHHFGRPELWRVPIAGGMPERYDFGECSLASMNASGKLVAFNRWSSENWTWKGYRGGMAADIWIGEFASGRFTQLTDDPANDLFPMWVRERVAFLSDRSGHPNLFSCTAFGTDLKQHTFHSFDAADPIATAGYDIRWPSAEAGLGGSRIVFAQRGDLAILDTTNDSIRRLSLQLASDRVGRRSRFVESKLEIDEFSLSPDGRRLLIGTRGELLSVGTDSGEIERLTRTPGAREWGVAVLADEQLVFITDASGEQQLVARDSAGTLRDLTLDREDWLFPPVVSPDESHLAFADKTQRLHVLNLATTQREIIDRSDAWEITDYRFSPDSAWLVYAKPMPNGYERLYLYSVRTKRTFPVTDGLHHEHHPRWDPKGQYLYFLSETALDPLVGNLDFEHIYSTTTQVFAVALSSEIPPPDPSLATAAGFDLEAWADPELTDGNNTTPDESGQGDGPMRVDTDELAARVWPVGLKAGNYTELESIFGGVCVLDMPSVGLRSRGEANSGQLVRFDLVTEDSHTLTTDATGFTISRDGSMLAYETALGILVKAPSPDAEPTTIDLSDIPLRIDIAAEWEHIFEEAWRLQRDFYWASNMGGVNWDAIAVKYRALLPRIATRRELNDLIGEMIGELHTSHTYIFGGDDHAKATTVNVGLLGVDIEWERGRYRIRRVVPGQAWSSSLASPIGMPHLGIEEGSSLLAINGVQLTRRTNIHELLQGQADRLVKVMIGDETGNARRTIPVRAISDEAPLRYAAWVEANRKAVAEATDGRVGYLHIPNMGGDGLASFARQFYAQVDLKGLIVDVRNNGGGFVSQMIVDRLARRVWGFQQPRHGLPARYPRKALHGHKVVLIDQHAGSDGDIFPESFRINELGPLIGTRTWGGVVGIRNDKPFVDAGMSTQPEFAWWEPKRGWSLENAGVSPDIEVDITPADRVRGTDTQLLKAIEVVLEKLTTDPMDLPQKPPLPDRRDN